MSWSSGDKAWVNNYDAIGSMISEYIDGINRWRETCSSIRILVWGLIMNKEEYMKKHDIKEWSIEECRQIYDEYGDKYRWKSNDIVFEGSAGCSVILNIVDRYLEIESYSDGYPSSIRLSSEDADFGAITFPCDSMIEIGWCSIFIYDAITYNKIVMLLKYADYLFDNNMITDTNPFEKYTSLVEPFDDIDLNSVRSVFGKYFETGFVVDFVTESATVQIYDEYNCLQQSADGSVTISLRVGDVLNPLPISYADLVIRQISLMSDISYTNDFLTALREFASNRNNLLYYFVTIEDELKYGQSINRESDVLRCDDDCRLYFTDDPKRHGGYVIKFENPQIYKIAVQYFAIATLKIKNAEKISNKTAVRALLRLIENCLPEDNCLITNVDNMLKKVGSLEATNERT